MTEAEETLVGAAVAFIDVYHEREELGSAARDGMAVVKERVADRDSRRIASLHVLELAVTIYKRELAR